jgi:hypothetical protein
MTIIGYFEAFSYYRLNPVFLTFYAPFSESPEKTTF